MVKESENQIKAQENQYPVSRINQCGLWKECMEDARGLAQEYQFQVVIASTMWQYRIQFLPDELLEEITDAELGELLEDGS
jgi:hypothetical protein